MKRNENRIIVLILAVISLLMVGAEFFRQKDRLDALERAISCQNHSYLPETRLEPNNIRVLKEKSLERNLVRFSDLNIIRTAARTNGIKYGSDDWYLLLAIKKAENGRRGCEFGIKHPKAWDTDLRTQAGWCSATIMKHHERYGSLKVNPEFIDSLGDRYCPASDDATGNENWKTNVKFWFNKYRGD